MTALLIILPIAAVAFFGMFSPWTQTLIPFWPVMVLTAIGLTATTFVLDRDQLKPAFQIKPCHYAIGLLAVVVLYGVFYLGNLIATTILPFAAAQITDIYSIREGQNPWLISALLVFIIGPAEEIFWRGFLQRRLSKKYGLLIGFILATAIYALVHIWSFNLMLIAAAALCGAFWGLLFLLTDNLWPCIISHAVWDVLIFIIIPIE